MPSRVPVRVAKYSSVPECGDPRSGPEWTRLDEQTRDKTSWFLCVIEPVAKNCCYMLFFDQTGTTQKLITRNVLLFDVRPICQKLMLAFL